MHYASVVNSAQQLQTIDHPCHLFQNWQETKTNTSPKSNSILKFTRSDITCLPQDSPVDRPFRTSETHTPHQHKQSPRVTPETQASPQGVDGVQYNFSSPKGYRRPYPRVSAPIAHCTCSHTDHLQLFQTAKPIASRNHSQQRLATSVTAFSASIRGYPSEFILNWAMPVLDE